MEQQGGEGGRGEMNQQQPRDQEMQGEGQVLPQPQQRQKCPRCDSLNTKFCYFNNYSLSQPRYFCKTCRRYWTQGGTLRNVPIGGGCRKAKRARNSPSSSSENFSRPPETAAMAQTQPMAARAKEPSKAVASPPPAMASLYHGGGVGYLSSLAAIHPINNPTNPFDHSLNVRGGGDVAPFSNLGLLSGFHVASVGSQVQIRPSQFFQVGSGGREGVSFYAPEHGLVPSTIANNSAVSEHDWPQSFINNGGGDRTSDASLWSTISTISIGGNSDRSAAGAAAGSSLVPNQWHDLAGFDPSVAP